MTSKGILFGEAFDAALNAAKSHAVESSSDVTIIRDLKGRIRLVLESGEGTPQATGLASRLSTLLGAYGCPPEESILFRDKLGTLDSLLDARLQIEDAPGVFLLDRQIIGHDWTRKPLSRTSTNKRFTFHGLKGGVGRSTALANWSWHLAELGLKILVIDLDLESPGLSSTLLPEDLQPDFGVVDWFVEDGVSQGDLIIPEMVSRSPLAQQTAGQILVTPSFGSKSGDYLSKLSRCYADFSAEGTSSWAARLNRLVEKLEELHRPDIVLFDSRAGLHDIAGVLITRMDADCFLFAVNSRQTWDGYGALFKRWKAMPELGKAVRPRLQMVAGLVPDTGVGAYLGSFQESSWDLFRENLYDEVDADDFDGFSFDLEDETAPHRAFPILWHRALMEFDPVANEGNLRPAVEIAYAEFFRQAGLWLRRPSEASDV
ncbi:MAG TPA: ParA family protein [Fibrobacteria bacterium]|nr:ParA family protein [Fibrobacteria bacterium]HOX51722.1 ParA family protein [Fibrobacteria bacterium]